MASSNSAPSGKQPPSSNPWRKAGSRQQRREEARAAAAPTNYKSSYDRAWEESNKRRQAINEENRQNPNVIRVFGANKESFTLAIWEDIVGQLVDQISRFNFSHRGAPNIAEICTIGSLSFTPKVDDKGKATDKGHGFLIMKCDSGISLVESCVPLIKVRTGLGDMSFITEAQRDDPRTFLTTTVWSIFLKTKTPRDIFRAISWGYQYLKEEDVEIVKVEEKRPGISTISVKIKHNYMEALNKQEMKLNTTFGILNFTLGRRDMKKLEADEKATLEQTDSPSSGPGHGGGGGSVPPTASGSSGSGSDSVNVSAAAVAAAIKKTYSDTAASPFTRSSQPANNSANNSANPNNQEDDTIMNVDIGTAFMDAISTRSESSTSDGENEVTFAATDTANCSKKRRTEPNQDLSIVPCDTTL